MARSSRGPRLTSVGSAPPSQAPEPRVVRLGRPANDNVRHFGPLTLALYGTFAAVIAVLALVQWQVI